MFDVGGVGGIVGETEGGAVRFAGALSRKDRVWIDSFHRGYKERLRRSKEEAVRRRGEKEGREGGRERERWDRTKLGGLFETKKEKRKEEGREKEKRKEIGTKDKVSVGSGWGGIKVENL